MKDYGIRNLNTGEIIETFDNAIQAEQEIVRKMANANIGKKKTKSGVTPLYQVVERSFNNIYKQFPDGRVYIVGVETVWTPYEEK